MRHPGRGVSRRRFWLCAPARPGIVVGTRALLPVTGVSHSGRNSSGSGRPRKTSPFDNPSALCDALCHVYPLLQLHYSRDASAITRFRSSWFIASAHCLTNSPIRRRPSEISGTHSDSDSEPDPVNMTVSPSPGVPCTENRARTGMYGPGKSSHRSGGHGAVPWFVGRGVLWSERWVYF